MRILPRDNGGGGPHEVRWRGRRPQRIANVDGTLQHHASSSSSTATRHRLRRPFHRARARSPFPAIAGQDADSVLAPQRMCCKASSRTIRIPRTKEREAERREAHPTMAASYGCRAHPAGCARLSALHRGSRLGDRTPPLSFGPRFTLWRIVTSGPISAPLRAVMRALRTLSAAKLSQTPGRPVIMPAGSMPKAARERIANPRAGAALAPYVGSHPDTSLT